MKTMDDLLDDFHRTHSVTYKISAIVDGEEVASFTDETSADALRGYACGIDDAIVDYAINERENLADLETQARIDMEREA